jgi:hypothetical protein
MGRRSPAMTYRTRRRSLGYRKYVRRSWWKEIDDKIHGLEDELFPDELEFLEEYWSRQGLLTELLIPFSELAEMRRYTKEEKNRERMRSSEALAKKHGLSQGSHAWTIDRLARLLD